MQPNMMTPDKVFVDSDVFKRGLAGAGIVPESTILPKPSTVGDVEGDLTSLFSTNDKYRDFFNLAKHFSGIIKSKKDAKEQFKKVFDIYILSLKAQYPTDDKKEQIKNIENSIKDTINQIDNFTKDGNMSNEYFKVGLAALLIKLL
jgi:hypothetical protein